DRVFDPLLRENAHAPPSRRIGAATAVSARVKPFAASMSATYTHAEFTGTDARFREGEPVPYAPRLVLRTDASVTQRLGRVLGRRVVGKLGAGIEGAAERFLPDGSSAKN